MCSSICYTLAHARTHTQWYINPDVCTVANLPPLLNQSSSTSTTSFSAIITSYSFDCCGIVSAWGTLINEKSRTPNRAKSLILNFQVWRPQNEESCRYVLIGSNNFNSSQMTTNNNFTVNVTARNSLGFRTNDVIGISVQNTSSTSESVLVRSNSSLEGVVINKRDTVPSRQKVRCVNLTASRIRRVPAITAIIGEFLPCYRNAQNFTLHYAYTHVTTNIVCFSRG